MSNGFEFRVLIETLSGSKFSYGSSSFAKSGDIFTTSQSLGSINAMPSMSFYNGHSYTTASIETVARELSGTYARRFEKTLVGGDGTDYQYLRTQIKGSAGSGSIQFVANSAQSPDNDYIKRYKFFGNKVCNVMGLPENYWIYSDKFRLTNTGSEQNYLSGDVLAQSVNIRDNFAISNAGQISTDLPFKHSRDTDRWVKWTDTKDSASVPQNDMLIGYSNEQDRYEIRMHPTEELVISASTGITFHGDITSSGVLSVDVLESKGDGNTNIDFDTNDTMKFKVGNEQLLTLQEASQDIVRIGDGGDVDFKVSTLGDDFTIFAQGDTDNVGIGTDTPSQKLEVEGSISASGHLFLKSGGSNKGFIILNENYNLSSGIPQNDYIAYSANANEIQLKTRTFRIDVTEDLLVNHNISASGTFSFGTNTAETHAVQGVQATSANGGGFIGNSNGMIQGHEVGSAVHGHPSNFKYFFCGYLDEGDSGTYEQMFVEVYGGRYSYQQAGVTKYQITSRGSSGEGDFEIYRQRYGSFDKDAEKFDIRILVNVALTTKRYGVFICNTTDQFPNFSVRAWKLANNQTGQMQEIMVKEFESTLSGSGEPFANYTNAETAGFVERYNTLEVNRDVVNVEGNVSASAFLGYIPNSYQFRGTSLSSSPDFENRYFSFDSVGDSDNASDSGDRMIAAYDGYVARAVVRSKNAAGLSKWRLWRTTSGTNPDLTDDGATDHDESSYDDTYQLGSTVDITYGSANLSKTIPFGTSYSFSAGDILSISTLLTNDDASGEWNGVLVLMYNVT